ncbi:hypothetical protein D9613_004476 [Agrocybe pediades]|uniref:F-box domain-containing protein n=1 Tax=Agrocybe pediades TaxID=84607 RepID=A0A8H4QIF8_9AGAR|nr:hypothetical protein D9613_004476 [Agrocybe pediades]
MTCPHRQDEQSNNQRNYIDLSQLDYVKSECPFKQGTCQPCQKMREAEKDIADAIAHLKDVLNRHQQLKTEINHFHSPIIRDLPVEILSKIFYSCFSEGKKMGSEEATLKDSLVPLKIGGICRTWRQIARRTPELWTVILVRTPTRSSNQYARMTQWIQNSRALPVDVFILETPKPWIRNPLEGCDCWKFCLQLLAQCCDRWMNATLDLSWESYQYIASQLMLKPPTRKLTLRALGDSLNEGLKLWQDSVAGPQHIAINNGVRLGHFHIDWQRVTHVEIYNNCSPKECASLLQNAPVLESCSFGHVESVRNSEQLPERVCHTSLRHLSLECDTLPARFFDHVTLPSLTELDYRFYSGSNFLADVLLDLSLYFWIPFENIQVLCGFIHHWSFDYHPQLCAIPYPFVASLSS